MPSDPEDSTENPLADSPPKDEDEDFEPEPEPDPEQVTEEVEGEEDEDEEQEGQGGVEEKKSKFFDKDDDSEGDSDDDDVLSEESKIVPVSDVDAKTVSQHRKAYVKWLNEDFYKMIQRLEREGIRNKKSKDEKTLKVYQILVQKYLGIETPYRGLLVYHGLGTGKTATAISLAEGLSSSMKVNTLLPASLEGEFIKEIQEWGKGELSKDNRWKFYAVGDLPKEYLEQYGDYVNDKFIRKVQNSTITALRKIYVQDTELRDTEIDKKIKSMKKTIKSINGLWIAHSEGTELESMEEHEQTFVLQQITAYIHLKYNFIHYNPFPKVKKSSIKEFQEAPDDELEEGEATEDLLLDPEELKDIQTNNQRIVKDLTRKLKYNQKNHNINSPFYDEVLIIDEVHNFVRAILNPASKPSQIFYDWILNAVNVKLVFLSGTPVINKPCEIAILYNMLKGLIKVYTFTVKSDKTIEEINQKLTKQLYASPSLVELFYVSEVKGKYLLSFTQEHSDFENLRDEERDVVYTIQRSREDLSTFTRFIGEIYKALHKVFGKKDEILPSQDMFEDLGEKGQTRLYRGKKHVFDKDLDVSFNRQQRLFDIYENDSTGERVIDATKNEEFMAYFFEDTLEIPEQKRVLLKRMLMGLTTYYPIDRTSIVDMPQVKEPMMVDEFYKDFTIVKKLNVVPCLMSQTQFEKYAEAWASEKTLDAFRKMRGASDLFGTDVPYHYHTRTRQSCNMVFIEDDFRVRKKTEENKSDLEDLKSSVYDGLLASKSLSLTKDLKILSPKMFQIMNHMQKFMKDGKPTGKILFYSDFRSDAGSEAFELVLKSNGYSRFDGESRLTKKALRYTFITGAESTDERTISKKVFNDEENKHGEYIQVILISAAGAEGISLKCVRQVHILEPYWNYVRVDQVLGRAIRMKSHEFLPKEDRNVEQYLYLSVLPLGMNYESVYETIRDDPNKTWNLPRWESRNLKSELARMENKEHKGLLDSIIKINTDAEGLSSDQHLFDIMEKKHKVSLEINDIIKASSLDCIQHTRDDPELNDRCIRFADKLIGEIAYFPGVSASVLDNIDLIQLKAKYLYHIKPNIYVISAQSEKGDHNIFVYYEYSGKKDDQEIDVRYLRENGTRLADVYLDTEMVLNYVPKDHSFNSRLGSEFSVFQEIYRLPRDIIEAYISEDKFPPLNKIFTEDNLHGYKLKYNVKDTFYFMGTESILTEKCIQKVYPYALYEDAGYIAEDITTRVIYKGELYIQE